LISRSCAPINLGETAAACQGEGSASEDDRPIRLLAAGADGYRAAFEIPNPRLRTDMPRLYRLFALALLAAAACTPAIPAPEGPAPVTPAPAQAGDVAAARARWEARKPAAYAYDFSVSCFCIHRGEYAVEVRGGRITSLRAKDTGAAVPEDRARYILTVDQLFERIATASREGTPVRAAYDAVLGYPAEAEVGLLADDSGTLYRITNLRPL
jgi:hypothetical protein